MSDDAITTARTSLRARIVRATAGRDRVLDAVKAFALIAVVVGHSLAWHIAADGTPINVVESAPELVGLTWVFQVLPMFFAAGAVSNMGSWQRYGSREFWRSRTRGLLGPVLVYAGIWTVLMLTVTAALGPSASGDVVAAGRFLSFLLWFAGVYLLVVTAVPLTARWRNRPVLTLSAWFAVIVVVDVARVGGAPAWVGWCNLLLVWGWLHQWGYLLPTLRTQPAWRMFFAVVIALMGAVSLAFVGPYSSSLITVAGDPELSNLSPPSVVLALYGVAQICAISVLWRPLGNVFSHDTAWLPVAIIGARAMGIYLWHIPIVAAAVLSAAALGFRAAPLTPLWWVVHLAVVVVVIFGAWLVAGVAGVVVSRLDKWHGLWNVQPLAAAIVGGVVVLSIAATGFGTWWGPGALGIPASACVNLVILGLVWQGVARRSSRSEQGEG